MMTNSKNQVAPPLVIDGDLSGRDFRTVGSLTVRGNVGPGVTVQVGGTLLVTGWIEKGVRAFVGGDAQIEQGIRSAELMCEGTAEITEIQDSTVRVSNALNVVTEIRDSDVSVQGPITVTHGGIIGGRTVATDVISCRSLGPPPRRPRKGQTLTVKTTHVQISFSAAKSIALCDLDRRIRDTEDEISHLEMVWQPLLDDTDSHSDLTPSELAELEARRQDIAAARSRLRILEMQFRQLENHLLKRMSNAPRVKVFHAIYPGVEVRVWSATFKYSETVNGPITLTPKHLETPGPHTT